MLLLVLVALAQPVSSEYGFESHAGIFGGSGTPDFQCGESDPLPDGGWGSGSKYCLIETHETPGYTGSHGDLTIAAKHPRYAGYLLSIQNPALGGDMFALALGAYGDLFLAGNLVVSGNGKGLRNPDSYAAVYGLSTDAKNIPDVVVGPTSRHYSAGFNFGVWSGYEWTFRVRDDGAIALGDQVLKVSTNNDALYLTQELPDGGSRVALLRWQ
jgi:hypothetical protein